MKKFLSIAAVAILGISLAACGDAANTSVSASTEASVETPVSTEEVVASTEEVVATEEVAPADEATSMTYADYIAAEEQSEVNVEMYVQATQSWWDNKISVYAADKDGAYFVYNMACSEEDAAKLVAGTKILVKGYKTSWAGEVEIADATFEFVEGADSFVAEAKDVTEFVGTEELANYMNQLVSFNDMTVVAVSYKNNEPGDDIYVTLSKNDTNVEFCLEYYLNGSDEEFYNTVGTLEVGATVDVTAYLYWYEGADGHLTSVTVK